MNREFFLYSEEQGPAYEKITCSMSGSYNYIRTKMINEVVDSGWRKSKKYMKLSDYEKKLLISFINNAVLSAYRQWIEDGKRLPIDEAINLTNRIVLGGVSGFFDQKQ